MLAMTPAQYKKRRPNREHRCGLAKYPPKVKLELLTTLEC